MSDLSITYDGGTFAAYEALPAADKNRGVGLIVIHEIWGLNDHTKDIADRLAAEGYAALAVDLLSETGIPIQLTPSMLADMQDPEKRPAVQQKMRDATAPLQAPEFGTATLAKLVAALEHLAGTPGVNEVGVMGFCFGGTYSYALAAHEPRTAFALPFYGRAPSDDELAKIACPVVAFLGGKDEPLMQQLPHVQEVMKKLGKDFQAHVYPDAMHAFFNDTNPVTYDEAAASDSWEKVLAFLAARTY